MAQDVAASARAKLALAGYLGADLSRAIGAARRFAADVVHAHWWFPSGVVARIASATTKKAYVTTLHGTDVRLAAQFAPARTLFRGVLKRSARVTTVSSWLASEVERLTNLPRPLIAPMPVATERFVPGTSRHPNRLLFAGRLNKQKGLEHLLRGLAAMRELAMLDVVGEGSDAASLKRLASQLGVSDRVVWHGQLAPDGLLRMYQAATAVVVPSVNEGLGLVAAEALLCETPVIAFRSGGLTDVISHGVTGLLVSPGDTAELARALDSTLASPEHSAQLGKAGRAFALVAFSPESAARRYAGIYREVVAARAA
jgi:glycosyltransferase involved in cell wall biosynthesis